MLPLLEIELVTLVQILDQVFCILLPTNAHEESLNPSILLIMGKH